ncbi:MAG: hypothetical protein ACRDWT_00365 [Jatrophihabitantaceae bacterium]
MRIEWSDEFDHWFGRLEAKVDAGGGIALKTYNYIAAAFDLLRRLPSAPDPEHGTAQLKPVRQSRKHQVWRTAHPFDPDVAVRLIVWFPPGEDSVVVTLFAGDKKTIGDIWYSSVGTRADAAIRRWLMEQEGDDDGSA